MASAPLRRAAARMASTLRYDFAAGGGPISTASSAIRTASESASAVLWACTVRSPSSRAARIMRTAISPRLAMRSVRIAISSNVENDQRVTGVNRPFVFDEKFRNPPGGVGLHLVERLHHLDQADDIAGRDRVAVFLVGRLVRGRPAEEGPRQGRNDLFDGHFSFLPRDRI